MRQKHKVKTESQLALPIFCQEGHDFECVGDGYYKNFNDGVSRDPSIVYRMIFCTKCGANLEIIIVDRTPAQARNRK